MFTFPNAAASRKSRYKSNFTRSHVQDQEYSEPWAEVTKLKELTSTLTLVVVPAYVIQSPRIHSCDIGHMQMLDR